MSRKAKFTKEQKLKTCIDYLDGKESATNICLNLHVDQTTFYCWIREYNIHGERSFEETHSNKSYTVEQKNKIIKEALDSSVYSIAAKNNIAKSVIQTWIKKYNNGEEQKDYNPKSEVYSMKSRKATIEEKKEIINYVLSNNNDYKGAADKYSVPYHQVFNWVKKYNQSGIASFNDGRGRPSLNKPVVELTEVELLKIELEKQKQINSRLELANEILKKNIQIMEKLQRDFQK